MTTVKTRPAPRQAPRAGAGRKRIPHPFEPMARSIIGKRGADGRPLAAVHSFRLADGESLATIHQRFRRQLTRMGKQEFGGASFGMSIEVFDEKQRAYDLLFWDRGLPR